MNKRYNTSAQLSVNYSIEEILKRLNDHLQRTEQFTFESFRPNIRKAKLNDGSRVTIAGFDQGQGKYLAMIDHERVPGNIPREQLQTKWKNVLLTLFK